jgi:hypothetical protein
MAKKMITNTLQVTKKGKLNLLIEHLLEAEKQGFEDFEIQILPDWYSKEPEGKNNELMRIDFI